MDWGVFSSGRLATSSQRWRFTLAGQRFELGAYGLPLPSRPVFFEPWKTAPLLLDKNAPSAKPIIWSTQVKAMSISEFWNQAFISALSRLPAPEAKEEADAALELCILHWQDQSERLLMPVPQIWAQGDVTQIPFHRRNQDVRS